MARAIICERGERWAVALRGPLKRLGHRLVETRCLDDCWREVAASPASLVGLEATALNLEAVVPWMQRLTAAFPHARIVILGSPAIAPAEWVLREAGAVHVVFSPRQWQPLARIARRHLGWGAQGEESERQRVWRRLPWADVGSELTITHSRDNGREN
jgi:hypothetical protein